ncbi:hypothetical protein [Wenyingzhuangia sp. IMCC45574]
MKRLILILICIISLNSCSDDSSDIAYSDSDSFTENKSLIVNLPIKDLQTPSSLNLGEKHNIQYSYILPNSCYDYNDLNYIINNNVIKLAVEVFIDNSTACTQAEREDVQSFNITIENYDYYIFKLWKGKTSKGEDIFTEIKIPVNKP